MERKLSAANKATRGADDKLTAFLLVFSILTAIILPLSAVWRENAGIYDNVIRLHVLANSDSDEDQALKYLVRDNILTEVSEIVGGAKSYSDAKKALSENLDRIKAAAEQTIAENGSGERINVTLTRENYPVRTYENVTLPAGGYTSLRVLIGEAEGKNWWCVLFPKLCTSFAKKGSDKVRIADDTEELMIEAGLTRSQIQLMTGGTPDIVIRFRLLEFLESIFG